MLNNIKKYIKNHKKLNYLQRCIRRMGDSAFVDEVLEIGKNPLRINIQKLGDKNDGKLVYIAQTMGCDGLFAELRFLLAEIFFAERFGMVPVLKIPKTSCYHENHPVNGTTNTFEYYFCPVSDISLEDAEQSCAVVEHNYYQRLYIESVYGMNSGYMPSDDYMNAMADLVKRHLKLNEVCKPFIENSIKETIGDKKTLAVHVRGADFKRHYKNHPNMVSTDEYLSAVDMAMNENAFEQIFLATDDLEAIEVFKSKYGDKVVFYNDVIRTDGDETVMKSTSERENHHYKLGLEVLRDMYTLSYCDGIIAGLSNVSIFARIVKLSRGSDFEFMNYLNKGIKK